jgi:signal transduction histidine kinase
MLKVKVSAGVLRRATLIFLPLAFASIAIMLLLYRAQADASLDLTQASDQKSVEIAQQRFLATLATVVSDIRYLAHDPTLRRWLADDNPASWADVGDEYLAFVSTKGLYDKVRFIDLTGRERIRANWNKGDPRRVPEADLQDMAGRYFVNETLKLQAGDIYVSPFDLNIEHGQVELPLNPTIRIATLVYDPSGLPRGMIVLSYLGQRILDRTTLMSTPGRNQLWLINDKGYWLLGPSREVEWSFMFPGHEQQTVTGRYPGVWERVQSGPGSGQFETGQGLFTYVKLTRELSRAAAGGAVEPDSIAPRLPGWTMIAFTPQSVLDADLRPLQLRMILSTAVLLLLFAAASWFLALYWEERRSAEEQMKALNLKLAHDNAELDAVNRELESFSYSVSHDLRAPLRAIDGFSQALKEDYSDRLDAEGLGYLNRVRQAAQRMGMLIDDLLRLAHVTRTEVVREEVDLTDMADKVFQELQRTAPDRHVVANVAPGLKALADGRLMRVALDNLLGNAWKFTDRRDPARIELGVETIGGERAYFVRDNGAGFDMAYAGKLFGAFQRLHDAKDFPGTGVGLATVQRVIRKHGGRIWAQARPNEGATFYFTL